MSNVRLFTDIDTKGDVTFSTVPAAAPKLPATNLLLPSRSRVLRVLGDSLVLTAVYGEPHPINSLAVIRHSLGGSAVWRLEMFANPDLTGLVYDSDEIPALDVKPLGELVLGVDPLGSNIYQTWSYRHGTFYFDSVNAWSWRLTILDPGADHIDISRIIAGTAFSPEENPGYSLTHVWVDPSKQTRTAGNSLFTDAREPYRRVKFDLDIVTREDKRTLMELQRRVGTRQDIFISIYPDNASAAETRDGEFHAKFVENAPFTHSSFLFFSNTITCEEV